MIGIPPSQRGGRPADIAAHASQVAQEWGDVAEGYEYEELRAGGKHAQALRAAAKTDLPISDEARRLNRARAR